MAQQERPPVPVSGAKLVANTVAQRMVDENGHFARGEQVAIDNYENGARAGSLRILEALDMLGVPLPDPETMIEAVEAVHAAVESSRDLHQRLDPFLPRGVIGFGDA